MKTKILLVVLISATIFGCTKEEDSFTSSNTPTTVNTTDVTILRNGDAVKASRTLYEIYSGGVRIDVECKQPAGGCLDDVVISSPASYKLMQEAIKTDNQVAFFNQISYANVFGIEELHHIQTQLEKGHLKIKLVRTGNIDYCLFIKPQHEKFDMDKLVKKVVMTIPVLD
jgi:hypothetical protein